jgi:hypothetical protein
MDKIEAKLLRSINSNPKNKYNVIICTPIDGSIDGSIDEKKDWIELMRGIYSAELTGETIKKLADHHDVLSIEADAEMGIM